MKIDYLDKFKGTMMAVAIGDTLGHPFEGRLRQHIYSQINNDFDRFIKQNKSLFDSYTDDTQLTLHTARALIDGRGFKVNTFINEYIKWLDDPPIGPGYGCISSIRKLRYGIPWNKAASNSGGNGTAMRIAPIGLFYSKDLKSLKAAAISSSILTHSHSAASAGAVIIGHAIAYLLGKTPEDGFSKEEFFRVILNSILNSQDPIWDELIEILHKVEKSLHIDIESGLIKFSQAGVKSPFFIQDYLGLAFVHPYSISTVSCAIFIFLKRLDSFRDCIYELSTAGGDSDTVGAIGGSLAGAYFGFKRIPEDLVKLVKKYKGIMKLSENLYKIFKERY
ncbi:MAG: ADP-ribosylglycohydrolase family protein [Promethearchaeota archaeon]